MITKRQLLSIFKTQTAIAQILDISIQAVSFWELDAPIPAIRELQLKTTYPSMFGRPNVKELLPRLLVEHGPKKGMVKRRAA